ncbi:ATP-dependent Clp protease ATP-binding subunit [Nocardiopsis alba]|uniref:AAA domain-containing protein n=1 Tax=Nocardiopsis alba TaxID=53437 RepID=A0A7K2IXM9_9ACTN|nr:MULTISPECIES: ATP-dependent Clp protease ATP-binding subunit [Nocardiopsis]MEC3892020.1 ATP-dependent Clp protease ATP-binding subunit [Nocardiopsis sp. LDBS1602]MYR34606.1 AAA domain-containing protein [Nocardiopsis alba]
MTNDHPEGPGGDPGSFDEFLARFLGARGPVRRVDLSKLMSPEARQIADAAARRALQSGGADIDSVHLLWALLRYPPVRELVERTDADAKPLEDVIDQAVAQAPRAVRGSARLTPSAKRALLDSLQIARATGSSGIMPEHILFALAINPDHPVGQLLRDQGITPESLQKATGPASGGGQVEGEPSQTPSLDEFGTDMTALAREGRLDPVVGRDDEVEQCIEVLARRRKNNPVLIGDPGVGKTAIVEGIAQRIFDDDVPETLRGRRLVQLDVSGIVAGTRYRGDFEERLNKIVEEIRAQSENLLIFIDEIHTIVGAGASEGSTSAGNMLKPALARGELHIIGATTVDEYRKNIEKDAALERRFQPIQVPEPSVEDTVDILRGLRDRYEAHHQVRFGDESLVAAAEMSDRYITDRFLPDKAIDLVDQAGARVRLRLKTSSSTLREMEKRLKDLEGEKDRAVQDEDYEKASRLRDEINETRSSVHQARGTGSAVPEVGPDDIAEVVSRGTGIPVSQLTQAERDRLVNLEEVLHDRVIGQDEAVTAVSEAIRRNRAGLGDPDRPVGSFLFLGPTGVGKTELARALAEALFGSEDSMVRLDMSEFQERHTASRLTGAPPGFVGYEEAGQLTEAVRRHPYSVLLLDEIEKAHPDVFNLLLQLLDDGRLTDGQGRTVDFRNTVVIMTSNLGSEAITGGGPMGFTADGQMDADTERRVMRRLREEFRPEFINRIDEVIVFQQLGEEQIDQIARLMLERTEERMAAQDISIRFTDEAVRWISRRGYQPEFGARPLARTIQRNVGNRLSRMVLDRQIASGDRVVVDVDDAGELVISTE